MKWHIDDRHSWLEVSKAKLKNLGIAQLISVFSYQKDDKAYLEEDCDATLFFESYFKDKEWYKKDAFKREAQSIPETIYQSDAPIRNYSHYITI